MYFFFFKHPGVTNVIVIVYPVEIVVYFGAVVTSLFLMATLLTFAFARYCDKILDYFFAISSTLVCSQNTGRTSTSPNSTTSSLDPMLSRPIDFTPSSHVKCSCSEGVNMCKTPHFSAKPRLRLSRRTSFAELATVGK